MTCRLYKTLPLLKGNVTEAVTRRCSVKRVFLKISQNSQENTCARVSFLTKLQAGGFIKREILAYVFSCVFCEISKNTFLHRSPLRDFFWCKNKSSYKYNQRNQKTFPIAIKWTAKAKPCYFSFSRLLNDTTLSLWTQSVIIFLLLLK